MTLLEQKMMLRLPEDMKAVSWRYNPDGDVLFICLKNGIEWYKTDAWLGAKRLDYLITTICDCYSNKILGYIIQQFIEMLGERALPLLPMKCQFTYDDIVISIQEFLNQEGEEN